MQHWYGWLALAVVVGCAVHDLAAAVMNAWRGCSIASTIAMFAFWTTLAVALVMS